MSLVEKSDLYKAFLAGFDRYLKVLIKERLFEVEKACLVKTKEENTKKYSMKSLYMNYLKEKNFNLCVYSLVDEKVVEVYNSCKQNGEIVKLNEKKIFIFYNNNHFDIVQNVGLFLYGRKTSFSCKCMKKNQ